MLHIIDKHEIVKYVEPVLHFCYKRLANRSDAEDLASEIMLHILDGLNKYQIDSLEKWVWRIAHNKYARFIDSKNKRNEMLCDDELYEIVDDYDFVDALIINEEYEQVFKYLHTLSAEYKNIIVDYYINEIPIKELAKKYTLSENTIKWRLNISREKIKNRMGDSKMDKIYKRINWNTKACNGSMDSNKYLYSQTARAICEAAYEKPLTIEEISLKTGLPTMYIEDELPRLINGDAIEQIGKKHVTNFIIYRLSDKKKIEDACAKTVSKLADYYEKIFIENETEVALKNFYGSNFKMKRLGYIVLPALLRGKVNNIKNNMPGFEDGPYPPRKNGGYGWFIIQETDDENETMNPFDSGCNCTDDNENCIYYFWIGRYFDNNIYNNGGTNWLAAKQIPQKCQDGIIPGGLLSEDDIIRLLKVNLIKKGKEGYKLNFACFKNDEFDNFISLFKNDDSVVTKLLTDLIIESKKNFMSFVPKHLHGQINQYLSCSISCIGEVAEELIGRGVLEKPDNDIKLTNGVFFVEGKYKKL